MLNKIYHLADGAIGLKRIHRSIARAVIRDKQPIPGCIELQVAGPIARSRLMIEGLELKRFTLKLKCPYLTQRAMAVLPRFADRVQVLLVWMHENERRSVDPCE